jgi:DNA-binding transcriptional ArsR family regulator
VAIEKLRAPVDLSTLRSWTFITNHARVLLAVARYPDVSVGELAEATQISERSAYRILADLQKAGYVRRMKAGRENRYEINPGLPLLDPMIGNELVRDLLRFGGDEEVEAHLNRTLRRA